jgi:Domain of unknown function (DUF4375)
MDSDLLDKASTFAFARLDEVGNIPSKLPLPLQTLVVIYSAQGIIDNDGLEYFYERAWPGKPPYSFIASAYRRIGAIEAAECIESTSSMFPFSEPHLHRRRRERFMEHHAPPEFHVLSDRICGDASVWEKLSAYVEDNRSSFGDE